MPIRQPLPRHHQTTGRQLVLEDHSSFGTIVNQILVARSSVPLHHGDEIVFGQSGDGWRVRSRGPKGADTTTTPADPLELLVVSEAPWQVRIGPNPLEEHLGRRAFALLKFLSAHQGSWYPVSYLAQIILPDQELASLRPIEALSKYRKQINVLLKPYLNDQKAIEHWVNRGYRLRPRLEG